MVFIELKNLPAGYSRHVKMGLQSQSKLFSHSNQSRTWDELLGCALYFDCSYLMILWGIPGCLGMFLFHNYGFLL